MVGSYQKGCEKIRSVLGGYTVSGAGEGEAKLRQHPANLDLPGRWPLKRCVCVCVLICC